MQASQPATLPSRTAIRLDRLAMFFMSFPVVCFTLTLATDVLYWRTSFLMWHDFSAWLLFAGALGGGLALLTGVVSLFVRPRVRPVAYWLGVVVVMILGVLNNFVHAGDGWTAIVPRGLGLSAATVLALMVTGWLGRPAATEGAYRHV